ncbi:MAG: TIGR01458 family HAD-type hydrolase [Methanoregulaceae archaeon]|nr:TIGR01458 family HAD-type hydrolase [Methanoregulaceae archaeon]
MDVRGFLIDIDGVLVVGGKPVEGAVRTLETLKERGYAFRCVSNSTRRSRAALAAQLEEWGFAIPTAMIYTPPSAAIAHILLSGRRRCHLISTGDIDSEFERAGIPLSDSEVDFVIIGDAGDRFTFSALNRAFRLLLAGADLLALERDQYWMGAGGLMLAAGPFVAALEYATGKTALVMGKPSPRFFAMALADMGLSAGEAAMIGDDVVTDIGGAKKCGMQGILVRTGKFRPETLKTAPVQPDFVIGSFARLDTLL